MDQLAINAFEQNIRRGGVSANDAAWASDQSWRISLPDACIDELDRVVATLRAQPRPLVSVDPAKLPLAACAEFMRQVRDKLQNEDGCAVVNRLPVERYSEADNKAICWLLTNLLERVVAQKIDGTMLYDVKNSGKALDYGVRRSVTNLGQDFHTDGPWVWMPPAFIGLFCLQQAAEGGVSRCANLQRVHDEMEQRHPELLARLYQPFCWDRQAEHGPDEDKVNRHPVFSRDAAGRLVVRYYEEYITNGQALASESLDEEGRMALAVMRTIMELPENSVEFRLQQGEFQYVNNRQFAHSRSRFKDAEAASAKRHLVRVWARSEGGTELEGGNKAN